MYLYRDIFDISKLLDEMEQLAMATTKKEARLNIRIDP